MTGIFYSTERVSRFSFTRIIKGQKLQGKLKLFALLLLCVLPFSNVQAQAPLPFSEAFNAGSMPTGWNLGTPVTNGSQVLAWTYSGSGNGSNPGIAPHSATGMVQFSGYNCCSSGQSSVDLSTPLIQFGGAAATPVTIQVSYWMSTQSNYVGGSYVTEGVNTYLNSAQSSSGGTSGSFQASGSSSGGSNGTWVNVVNSITTTMASGYIVFKGTSNYGDNLYIDDVSICQAATISTQPTAHTICAGNSTSFSVAATNATSYQWQVSANNGPYTNISDNSTYSGSTTNTLQVNATTALTGNSYKCQVGGGCATPTASTPGLLTVNPLPTIIVQPVGAAVCSGINTSFSVAASNATGYQWQVNTGSGNYTNITNNSTYTGATTPTLNVAAPGTAMNGYTYRCMASGTCTPSAFSNPALLQIESLSFINLQPVANKVICPNGNGSLTVGVTGSNITYQWQVNNGSGYVNITDGGIYSGSQTTTLNITGAVLPMNNYNYQCVISASCSPSLVSSATTISVTTLPAPVVTALSATTFCPGQSVTLSTVNDTTLTYQWLMNNGLINSNGTTNSYAATSIGAYQLQITNIYGCTAVSNPTNVQWLIAPVVTALATGDTTVCQGNSVSLHGSTGTNYIYYWKQNGNYISGANSSTYAASTSGSYAIEESNGTCATVSSPIQVTINPLPAATVSTNNISSFCPGGSITIKANTAAGLSYQWHEAGATISGADSTYIATNAGTYYVTVTDNNGCSAVSSSVALTLNPVPAAVITVTDNLNVICYNSTRSLQANTGANLSYQWMYNGFPLNGATNPVLDAMDAGSYSVVVTNQSGCNTSSAVVPISADGPINLQITTVGTTLCAGPFSSYKWYLQNQPIPSATNACYEATVDGSYAVVVSDVTGCTKMSDPFLITNVGVATVASVKDAIKVYPNPATSVVHIDAPVVVNITITSIDGRVVLTQHKAKDVNISSLSEGIYMMSIYNTDNTLIKIEKVVVGN